MSSDEFPPHFTPEYMAENRGPTIIGVMIAVSVLSTIFVGARIFTRARLTGNMFLDDWLVIVSAISQWCCVGLASHAVINGNGRHFDVMLLTKPRDLERALMFTLLNFPFGIVAFGLPKIAVVALLVRIMNPGKWHRMFLWALSGLCFTVLLGCTPMLFLQCTPSHSQWDLQFPADEKSCWPKHVLVDYAIASGSLSAFTDLYLAVYPAWVLWGLQLNIKKKIALSVALGIGSISTVVAIYKCTRLPSLASDDFTWNTADLVIWTVVEASVIIIACCIPLLQPLVDLIFGRRTLTGSKGYKQYGSSRDGSAHLRSGDIELNKKGAKGATDVSRIHSDFDDDLMQTRAEVGSQESILHEESETDLKLPMQSNKPVDPRPAQRRQNSQPPTRPTQIMRTHEVTVSYSNDRKDGDDRKKNWAAV